MGTRPHSPHSQSGPPRFLHLVPQAAAAGRTLLRERLSQQSRAGRWTGVGNQSSMGTMEMVSPRSERWV